MINMKPQGAPDSRMGVATYRVLTPVKMLIRRPDGLEVMMGYGIGDTIEVLEPAVQFCIPRHEELVEIPLADGSVIIQYDKTAKFEYYGYVV